MEVVEKNGTLSDRSSDEKAATHHLGNENHATQGGGVADEAGLADTPTVDGAPLVDPDADLSDAQRAAVVSLLTSGQIIF